MTRPSPLMPFVVALLAPSVAWAGGTAVVAPFIAQGVDDKTTKNLTGLVSSELDFSGSYDTVNELAAAPAATCVTSTTCLAGLAKTNSADAVLVGVVMPGSKGLKVQLVLYDAKKGAIAKNKTWEIGTGVAEAAGNAPKMVKELLGGASPADAAAKEVAKVSIDTEEADDFSFSDSSKPKTKMTPTVKAKSLDDIPEDEELDEEDTAMKAQAAASDRLKAEAAAKAESVAKAKAAAEAKARADAEAKARAEADAKARAEAEAKARAVADAKAKADAKARAEAEARQAEEDEAEEREEAERLAKESAAKSKKAAPATAAVSDFEDEGLFDDEGDEPVAKTPSKTSSTSSKTSTPKVTTPPPPPKKVLDDEMSDEELERQLAGFSLSGSVADSGSSVPVEPAPAPKSTYKPTKSYEVEEDEEPVPVAKKKVVSYDDDEVEVVAKKKSSWDDEDEPVAKAKKKSYDEDEDEPVAKAKKKSYDEDEDEPVAKAKKKSYDEDDEPIRSRYDEGSSSSRVTKSSGDASGKNHVAFTARAGYSRYDDFNFFNYGGELAIPVTSGVYAMLGAEGASTNRGYSDKEKQAIATQNGITEAEVEDWNTILPFNLGVQYKATANKVQPYGGADLTITPYTANFDVAIGARARGGVDFLVAENFGLNLDLALGFMSGDKLQYVAPGVPKIGFLPRITAGTVVVF